MQNAVGQTVTLGPGQSREWEGSGRESLPPMAASCCRSATASKCFATMDSRPRDLRQVPAFARGRLCRSPESARGGRARCLSLSDAGLGWADYVALFDEANGRMDVQGWVTLTNNSGTPYVNASTLAGRGERRPRQIAMIAASGYPPPPPPAARRNVRAGTETAGARAAWRFLSLSAARAHDDRRQADQAGQLPRRPEYAGGAGLRISQRLAVDSDSR